MTFKSPYFIAEIGANHNGDITLGKKLIELAKQAGADCVKFQSWTPESVFASVKYEQNYFLADDYRDRRDTNLKEIVTKYQTTQAALIEYSRYCDHLEIDFACTPFALSELSFLVSQCNCKFIKIASMDVSNLRLIKAAANAKLPVIMSTGLHTLAEIDTAAQIFLQSNVDLTITHCLSVYPAPPVDSNLRAIQTLNLLYPDARIGFSDHSIGSHLAVAASTLGAEVFEKHFTDDTERDGWDHHMSMTPKTFQDMVMQINEVRESLGFGGVTIKESHERVTEFRRSIVLARDMKAGDELTLDCLTSKRPMTGICPSKEELVIGRLLNVNLKKDEILQWSHLQ